MRREQAHRLDVDWTRCAGHGVCAAALGERITRDQWGFPVLGEGGRIPRDLLDPARTAVATCPAVALRLRKEVDR